MNYAEVARELCPYLNHDRCICPRIARALAQANRAGQERAREEGARYLDNAAHLVQSRQISDVLTAHAAGLRALPIEEPEP